MLESRTVEISEKYSIDYIASNTTNEPEQEVIILLPGIFLRPHHYEKLLKELDKQELPYASPDLLWSGSDNDKPDTLEEMAKKLLNFIQDRGYQNVILVGHSYGGMVANYAALLSENFNVRKVVNFGTQLEPSKDSFPSLMFKAMKGSLTGKIVSYKDNLSFFASYFKSSFTAMLNGGPKAGYNLVKDMLAYNIQGHEQKSDIPFANCVGGMDIYYGDYQNSQQALEESLKKVFPNGELKILVQEGHEYLTLKPVDAVSLIKV